MIKPKTCFKCYDIEGHKLIILTEENVFNLRTADDANCIFLTKVKIDKKRTKKIGRIKHFLCFYFHCKEEKERENPQLTKIHDN